MSSYVLVSHFFHAHAHSHSNAPVILVVYRSDKKDDHLNPLWKESGPIDLEWFCDGNPDLELKITLWDYQSRSEDRIVGSIQHVTAQSIIEHVTIAGNGDLTKALKFKNKEKDVGDLIILKAKIEQKLEA